MNPFEMVVLIVAIVMIAGVLRTRYSAREGRDLRAGEDEENARLRTQVKQLQDRIHVLERIVTDRGVETAAQIEALRDRDSISDGDKVQ